MKALLKNAWIYTPGGVIRGGCLTVDGNLIDPKEYVK